MYCAIDMYRAIGMCVILSLSRHDRWLNGHDRKNDDRE
jgi:hypothetical protein